VELGCGDFAALEEPGSLLGGQPKRVDQDMPPSPTSRAWPQTGLFGAVPHAAALATRDTPRAWPQTGLFRTVVTPAAP
jgi:hypothetical protein